MAEGINGLPCLPRNQSQYAYSAYDAQQPSTFQQLARMPLASLQQKNRCSLPRITKKQELLPELLRHPVQPSQASRQWNISEPANMHNTFQLNKIAQEGQKAMIKYIEAPLESASKELRGMKLSFRKKMIEPLEPLQGSSFAAPLSSKRHNPLKSQNIPVSLTKKPSMERHASHQSHYKHSLSKLAPLSNHLPTTPRNC